MNHDQEIEQSSTISWSPRFVGVLLFLLALVGTALASRIWFWLVQEDDLGRLARHISRAIVTAAPPH